LLAAPLLEHAPVHEGPPMPGLTTVGLPAPVVGDGDLPRASDL
jgi:hypothetical protein